MRTTQQHNQKQCGKCKIIKEITAFARLSKNQNHINNSKTVLNLGVKNVIKNMVTSICESLEKHLGQKATIIKTNMELQEIKSQLCLKNEITNAIYVTKRATIDMINYVLTTTTRQVR